MGILSIIIRVIFGLMLVAGVVISIMTGISAHAHGASLDSAMTSAAIILVVFVIVISILMLMMGRLWGTRRR